MLEVNSGRVFGNEYLITVIRITVVPQQSSALF